MSAMSFQLSDEQQAIQDMAREFAANEIPSGLGAPRRHRRVPVGRDQEGT